MHSLPAGSQAPLLRPSVKKRPVLRKSQRMNAVHFFIRFLDYAKIALRGLNSVVAPGRTAGTEVSSLEICIFSDNNVFIASRFPCFHFEVGRFFVFLIPSSFVL